MDIKKVLERYEPMNEQEMMDKKLMIDFIEHHDNYLDRSNLYGHFTASSFVVNKALTKIVFGYHHIYQSWSWIGGHADGNDDLLAVALKETSEETGLHHLKLLSPDIFSIDVIYVHNHQKYGQYVPDHLHLNVAYVIIADEDEPLEHNHLEHAGVRWFDLDEVMSYISENRMKAIYEKAFNKLKMIQEQRKV